ncbi:MAG: hypothetical protein ABI776_04720 [Nocardioidaceae bacterium]
MPTTIANPKLEAARKQLLSALTSSSSGNTGIVPPSTRHDATSMATSLLGAYQSTALADPGKAFRPSNKDYVGRIDDPTAITQKAWWDDVWNIVQTVAPVVIDAVSKDYQPPKPDLNAIAASIPESRRSDSDFMDYATALTFTLGQGTVQAMQGSSDRPDLPAAPAGKDKGWFDDVCHFVSQAAPVVLPIVMSLL